MNWIAAGGLVAALAISSSTVWAQAHVAGSERFIRGIADKTMGTLAQRGLSDSDRQARFKLLFNDAFAVRGIASFVIGRNWRQATPAQQQEFVELFEDITVRTWSSRFVEYAGQEFVVLGAVPAASAVPGENSALVRTELRKSDGGGYKIEWRVANKDTLYKITDILVEGISLANTHRDEYATVMSRGGGIDGLLKVLREKRDGLTAATASAR